MLPTLEALVDFALLKLRATQALSRLKALAVEVSAKGGGWGEGVSRMREVSGMVGRREVGGLG